MPTLERDGEVFVLHLDADDENRFHPDRLTAIESALDEVDAAPAPRALVTVGHGKFWCNGLDLDWVTEHPDEFGSYVERFDALLARTLASPVVSVAAINGHAFAGGGLWALAHDQRVMRADRGYLCLPEVDIDMAFQPGMAGLVRDRVPPAVAHEMMTTGRRYGGEDAQAAGIVDAAVDADDVLPTALERARALAAKSIPIRGTIKETMYAPTLAALRAPAVL